MRQLLKEKEQYYLQHGDFLACHQWTAEGKRLTATSLSLNLQSLDPLFQLVHNCNDVFALIKALVWGTDLPSLTRAPELKPVTAGMHFKVLQGLDVSSKKSLLLKVYKGELNWKAMENEANEIKARTKVLAALMLVLEKSWDKLVQQMGAQQLEQFVHQWATSFHRMQISKKDFPPNFKELAASLLLALRLKCCHAPLQAAPGRFMTTVVFPSPMATVSACRLASTTSSTPPPSRLCHL